MWCSMSGIALLVHMWNCISLQHKRVVWVSPVLLYTHIGVCSTLNQAPPLNRCNAHNFNGRCRHASGVARQPLISSWRINMRKLLTKLTWRKHVMVLYLLFWAQAFQSAKVPGMQLENPLSRIWHHLISDSLEQWTQWNIQTEKSI